MPDETIASGAEQIVIEESRAREAAEDPDHNGWLITVDQDFRIVHGDAGEIDQFARSGHPLPANTTFTVAPTQDLVIHNDGGSAATASITELDGWNIGDLE